MRNLHVRIYNDVHCSSFSSARTSLLPVKIPLSKLAELTPTGGRAARCEDKRKENDRYISCLHLRVPSFFFFTCPLFNLLKFLRWAIKKAAKKMTGFRVRTYRVTTASRIRTDNSAPSLNHRNDRFSPRLLSRLFILMFSFCFAKRVYMLYFSFLMMNCK